MQRLSEDHDTVLAQPVAPVCHVLAVRRPRWISFRDTGRIREVYYIAVLGGYRDEFTSRLDYGTLVVGRKRIAPYHTLDVLAFRHDGDFVGDDFDLDLMIFLRREVEQIEFASGFKAHFFRPDRRKMN